MSSPIVWDIDGCLVDFTREIFIPTANELLGMSIDPTTHIQPSWSYSNILTSEDEAKVWSSSLLDDYILSAKPLPHALNLLRSMSPAEGSFLTFRGCHKGETKKSRRQEVTEQWLESIGLGHFPVYYAPNEEKVDVVLSLGATMAFEDYPETVMDYAEHGITVFMPVYPYNQHVTHPNVITLGNWS